MAMAALTAPRSRVSKFNSFHHNPLADRIDHSLSSTSSQRSLSVAQSNIVKAGYMEKKGGLVKTWKRRWFVLMADRTLKYYERADSGKPIKTIFLDHVKDIRSYPLTTKPGYCFVLSDPKRTWYLLCSTDEDRSEWMSAIERVQLSLTRVGSRTNFGSSPPPTDMSFFEDESDGLFSASSSLRAPIRLDDAASMPPLFPSDTSSSNGDTRSKSEPPSRLFQTLQHLITPKRLLEHSPSRSPSASISALSNNHQAQQGGQKANHSTVSASATSKPQELTSSIPESKRSMLRRITADMILGRKHTESVAIEETALPRRLNTDENIAFTSPESVPNPVRNDSVDSWEMSETWDMSLPTTLGNPRTMSIHASPNFAPTQPITINGPTRAPSSSVVGRTATGSVYEFSLTIDESALEFAAQEPRERYSMTENWGEWDDADESDPFSNSRPVSPMVGNGPPSARTSTRRSIISDTDIPLRSPSPELESAKKWPELNEFELNEEYKKYFNLCERKNNQVSRGAMHVTWNVGTDFFTNNMLTAYDSYNRKKTVPKNSRVDDLFLYSTRSDRMLPSQGRVLSPIKNRRPNGVHRSTASRSSTRSSRASAHSRSSSLNRGGRITPVELSASASSSKSVSPTSR